eukprot:1225591-Prymnesium_polylepis.1
MHRVGCGHWALWRGRVLHSCVWSVCAAARRRRSREQNNNTFVVSPHDAYQIPPGASHTRRALCGVPPPSQLCRILPLSPNRPHSAVSCTVRAHARWHTNIDSRAKAAASLSPP